MVRGQGSLTAGQRGQGEQGRSRPALQDLSKRVKIDSQGKLRHSHSEFRDEHQDSPTNHILGIRSLHGALLFHWLIPLVILVHLGIIHCR